jgi:hypothetical protein
MGLSVLINASLPPLAWFARIDRASDDVTVTCGSAVESSPEFIVEGVWNGDFVQGDFGTTDCFFGSGLIARNGEILIIPSAATTDAVVYSESDAEFIVSNSLPLLLAVLDDTLRPEFFEYDRILDSVLNGIYRYERDLPTTKGTVHILVHWNGRIKNGMLNFYEKIIPPHFPDYGSYVGYIRDNYRLISENARSADRSIAFRILTTQSRGYDSTAVNSIAAPFGIDHAYTVSESKGENAWATADKSSQKSDDGSEICQILGIPYTRINRRSFENGFPDEHLFHAAVHNNEDANILDIIKSVDAPSLLLTGVLGEIWYTDPMGDGLENRDVDADLKRWDLGFHGLKEIQLHSGFVQIPLIYIGARRRPDIFRITGSDAMKPWSLPQMYNRPIPRRIAEEAGVPRTAFGQIKMASAVAMPIPNIPVSPDLRNEYFKFLKENKILSSLPIRLMGLIHKINKLIYFFSPRKYKIIYYISRIISRVKGSDYSIPLIGEHLRGSLFTFSVNKTSAQYKKLIEDR